MVSAEGLFLPGHRSAADRRFRDGRHGRTVPADALVRCTS
jgi:hypothetical protein